MENHHFSDLVQPSVDQIRSDLVLGPNAGYQEALFILPPNHISSPDPLDNRRISVVSTNEASVEGEDDGARCQCLHLNGLRATRCWNKETIAQGKVDLGTVEGCHPGVTTPRPVTPTLRNLDNDFILNATASRSSPRLWPIGPSLQRARAHLHILAAQVQ